MVADKIFAMTKEELTDEINQIEMEVENLDNQIDKLTDEINIMKEARISLQHKKSRLNEINAMLHDLLVEKEETH